MFNIRLIKIIHSICAMHRKNSFHNQEESTATLSEYVFCLRAPIQI